MKKLKVLSLFSGIGAPEKALKNIGIDFSLVAYSEISKDASIAYSKIHNVSKELNFGDISKIDVSDIPKHNIVTWGFPCTNFSHATRDKANNRNGLENDESGLYYEGMRILRHCKPEISIIENVPDLISNKFKSQFDSILNDLSCAGYNSYFKIVSGIDFNLPQNRSRLFIVSIRKDIDKGFSFPESIPLTRVVNDFLETEVDEKFLKVNPTIIDKIKKRRLKDGKDICPTITKAIGRAGSSSEYISNCAVIYQNTGIVRRMTPKETMLLMGFENCDFEAINGVISNTQIYNCSGNSICVPVLEHLFNHLLIEFGYKDIILNNSQLNDSVIIECSVYGQLKFNFD